MPPPTISRLSTHFSVSFFFLCYCTHFFFFFPFFFLSSTIYNGTISTPLSIYFPCYKPGYNPKPQSAGIRFHYYGQSFIHLAAVALHPFQEGCGKLWKVDVRFPPSSCCFFPPNLKPFFTVVFHLFFFARFSLKHGLRVSIFLFFVFFPSFRFFFFVRLNFPPAKWLAATGSRWGLLRFWENSLNTLLFLLALHT